METENDFLLELGGKVYKTTQAGNTLWMAENLALLVNGSWFYNENALHGPKYGRLYTWQAAMDACPPGWRLPTVADFENLIEQAGGENNAFNGLLEGGTTGFDARFAGYRSLKGDFLSIDRAADFWSATEAGESNAWLFYIIFKKDRILRIIDDKRCGYSVRYVRTI